MGNMVFKEENSSIVKYWTIINCQESSCQIRSANGVKESFGRSWLLGKDGGKYVSPGIAPPPWVSSVESSVGPPAHLSIDSSGRGDSVWKHRSWCQRTRYFTLWSLSNHGWQEGLPPWLYSIVNPQRPHPTEDCPLTIPIPTHSINVWSAEQRMSKKKRGGGGGGQGVLEKFSIVITRAFLFFPNRLCYKVWMKMWTILRTPCTIRTVTDHVPIQRPAHTSSSSLLVSPRPGT